MIMLYSIQQEMYDLCLPEKLILSVEEIINMDSGSLGDSNLQGALIKTKWKQNVFACFLLHKWICWFPWDTSDIELLHVWYSIENEGQGSGAIMFMSTQKNITITEANEM